MKQYHVLRDANQLVLNCKRFSHFWSFIHDIITHYTTHRNIMYLCKGHSTSTSIGKGEGVDKESSKHWHRNKDMMFLSQIILLCTFLCNWICIPSWNREHTQERASQYIWSNYLIFVQKYCNFTALSMWVVL